ncbi:MAG: asparagine synthase (glutamine-hydrolyzing) [Proteobacteria bacterium]|nr:asparagine synthase (glutamine-hydrolyzing) [Pseudomonadota bacterium]
MCGITGLLDLSGKPVDAGVLGRMCEILAHRGPDDSGVWTDGPIGLAHRRLSIIDLKDGQQPMADAQAQVVVTYNGEIYNFQELRAELEGLGHVFRTRSDTEVLLKSYLQWGEDLATRFNGMFGFAVWDGAEKKLILVRDRLGIKPVYWTRIGDQIAFASENKAFMRHPGFVAEADLDGISSYLTFRQAVFDITFFKGVNKVLPGHVVTFKDGDVRSRAYWTLPVPEPKEDRGQAYYLEEAEELLSRAVKRRMIADVPVGAYLSGGVDSSVIAALMVRHAQSPVKTFSVGYIEEGYDEGDYAQAVADHIGSEHEHLILKQEDYFDNWRGLISQNDIPLSIPHEVALYQLSAHMKTKVTVALSGEGADELFGGYGRVQRSPMDWKKIAAARAVLGGRLAGWIGNREVFKDTAWSWLRHASHLDHFFDCYNWMPFEEKWSLMTPDALRQIDTDARTIGVFRKIFEDDAANADPYDRVLHTFQKIHLGGLLDRLDMMSMASGLEARVPFVDHELIEFMVHVPRHHKMKWKSPLHKVRALFHSSFTASEWLDVNKVLIRKMGEKLVPPEIARRKKLGFPTPLDSWMQGRMRGIAQDLLLDQTARERGIFIPEKVEAMLANRQDLPYDFYGKKVWMMMNVELWFREVIGARKNDSAAAQPAAVTA